MPETRKLRLDIHHEADHVWAEVVDLPGCFASGADMDELREALAEAIGMWLSDEPDKYKVVGLEIPTHPAVQRVPARVQLVAA